MLSIFKKIFGKSEPKAVVAPTPAVPSPQPSAAMPTIEVAHLSLAAIVARFPDDLKPLLLREPEATATVALPVPTILKQLATGSVKMSLASLHRQAHGLIKPLPPGDKRSVEVPLAEIFRHIRPDAFRRRSDQRVAFVPEDGFNLFGDSSNPFSVAPDDVTDRLADGTIEPEPQVLDLTSDVAQETPRVLKMDFNLHEHAGNGAAAEPAVPPPAPSGRTLLPPPDLTLISSEPPVAVPVVRAAPAPKASIAAPATAAAPAPATPVPAVTPSQGATQAIPLASLSADWPEEIGAEIAGFDPATVVALPVNDVTSALARGRVLFSWAQIHAWLQPAAAPSAVAGDAMLKLPLKVIAPAFLPATRKPDRKSRNVDADIPALFSDGRPPAEKLAAEEPPAEEPAPEAAPAAEAAAAEPIEPEPAPAKAPETVGEIFGQPHKQDWTPAELVAGTVTLPGVAGAVVALQEGLQVSASLPEGVKSDVVAAFLPQIFARLNQYAGEMRLGDVDDLLFTTHGAHCQIYRLGYIYFAILGKAGESLPWHELRLITEELARQTHK